MPVSTPVTELGPFERQLTVTVDAETLDGAKTRAARRLSRDLRIKGFRPGKAPRRIVENTVGETRVKEEAIDEVLPELVGSALQEADLEPAVTPSVDAIRDADDGVEVDVRITLWPALDTVPPYDGRQIEVEAPEMSEEAVEEQLDRLRQQFAELETVERPSVDGDYVAINLNATQNGQPVEEASAADLLYEVGSGTLLEGLDGSVIGRSAGDIEKFTTTLPEGLAGELAGSTAEVSVLVKEVKAKRLPDLDDEWVSDYTEFDTVEDLRGELVGRMEQMRLATAQQDFQGKLMAQLLEEIEIDTPDAIITAEMDAMFHRFAHQLGDSEIEFADYLELSGQTQEAFLDDLRAQATRSVHTDLLLDAVAADADLEVADTELSDAYAALATQVEETADELAGRLSGTVQEKRIAGDILRRKALDALMRGAIAVDEDGNTLDLELDPPELEDEAPDETEAHSAGGAESDPETDAGEVEDDDTSGEFDDDSESGE